MPGSIICMNWASMRYIWGRSLNPARTATTPPIIIASIGGWATIERWANADTLDSVTNYECYKGLYSSLVDQNYFEIAHALNRQFGSDGLYRDVPLYNFADNHDVDHVASKLTNPAHLYPLYGLLFTMPGVPSLYYGSEWGLEGKRTNGSDAPLRPSLDRAAMPQHAAQRDLAHAIARLARLRQTSPALRYGDYRQLLVSHEQLAFARQTSGESVLVLLNASDQPAPFELKLPGAHQLVDVLNGGEVFHISQGKVQA